MVNIDFSTQFAPDLIDDTRGSTFVVVGAFSVYFTVRGAVKGPVHVAERGEVLVEFTT